MAGATDDIEAVARAVFAKCLGHDGKSEDTLAVDVETYRQVAPSYPEAGAMASLAARWAN